MKGIFRPEEWKVAPLMSAPPLHVFEYRGWRLLTTADADGKGTMVALSSQGDANRAFASTKREDVAAPSLDSRERLTLDVTSELQEITDVRGEAIGYVGISDSGAVLICKKPTHGGGFSTVLVSLVTGIETPAGALYEQIPYVVPFWRLLLQGPSKASTVIAERTMPEVRS